MEPENNDGNVEYKRHLVNKSDDRIEKLTTQMKYRSPDGEKTPQGPFYCSVGATRAFDRQIVEEHID